MKQHVLPALELLWQYPRLRLLGKGGDDSEDVQAAAGAQRWLHGTWTLRFAAPKHGPHVPAAPSHPETVQKRVTSHQGCSAKMRWDEFPTSALSRWVVSSPCEMMPWDVFSAPSPLHSGNLNLKNAFLGFRSFYFDLCIRNVPIAFSEVCYYVTLRGVFCFLAPILWLGRCVLNLKDVVSPVTLSGAAQIPEVKQVYIVWVPTALITIISSFSVSQDWSIWFLVHP